MAKDPRIDAYIARSAAFARPILDHLRALVHTHAPAVEETIKWNMPFFTLNGRPFAGMAAFKAHASFGFWNRRDVSTGLEGEAMGNFGRITTLADLPPNAEIGALIEQAVVEAGAATMPKRGARRTKPEAEVPPALAAALAGDGNATATWTAFPPSCRREYCEWVASAKRDETRAKRVAQTIDQLREGKRFNWQYAAG